MDLVLKKVTNWWQAKIDGKLDSPVFKTKAELLDHYMVHHIVEEVDTSTTELAISSDDDIFTKILKVAIKSGCYLFTSKPSNIEVLQPFVYKLFYGKNVKIVSVNDLLTVQAGLLGFLIGKDWIHTDWYKINEPLGFMSWVLDMEYSASRAILLFVKLYEIEERVSFINSVYTWPLKF